MNQKSLADRMKGYEAAFQPVLPRRMPLIIRADGRAFHTLTKGLPAFHPGFMDSMVEAAHVTAEEMQGFAFGYVQSDEASFFLQDYAELSTEPWFGKNLSKVVSLAAATMTTNFRNALVQKTWEELVRLSPEDPARADNPYKRFGYATFDARAFVLPEAEVANYFLWRAQDWARNSLAMLAQVHFNHKELHKKRTDEVHEMLHRKGLNWATLPERARNGTFLLRVNHGEGPSDIERSSKILPRYQDIDAALRTCGQQPTVSASQFGTRFNAVQANHSQAPKPVYSEFDLNRVAVDALIPCSACGYKMRTLMPSANVPVVNHQCLRCHRMWSVQYLGEGRLAIVEDKKL